MLFCLLAFVCLLLLVGKKIASRFARMLFPCFLACLLCLLLLLLLLLLACYCLVASASLHLLALACNMEHFLVINFLVLVGWCGWVRGEGGGGKRGSERNKEKKEKKKKKKK